MLLLIYVVAAAIVAYIGVAIVGGVIGWLIAVVAAVVALVALARAA